MDVCRVTPQDELWTALINYAQNCPWGAGPHLAQMLRENRFTDWEAVFAAVEDGLIVGFCTLLKEDYYPENRYSPWISSVFVDEGHRGQRISHRMIGAAERYARSCGFARAYIPSDMVGFYEKCGYVRIDELTNYGGDVDQIFAKDL